MKIEEVLQVKWLQLKVQKAFIILLYTTAFLKYNINAQLKPFKIT
jgi:hypothetical protein